MVEKILVCSRVGAVGVFTMVVVALCTLVFGGVRAADEEKSATKQPADPGGASFGALHYPHLVVGLKKIPVKNIPGHHTATPIRISSCENTTPTTDMECFRVTFVTREGVEVVIELHVLQSLVAMYMHEIQPEFGRYMLWWSALWIPARRAGEKVLWHELTLVGRFLRRTGETRDEFVIETYR